MTKEITDKTHVLVTRLGDYWIKPQQGETIMALRAADPSGNVDLEGNNIAFHSIDGLLTAEAYDKLQKKRSGAWQCKWHYWHERNQQCAHSQLGKYAS